MIIKACSAVGNNCFEISSFVINTILNSTCYFFEVLLASFELTKKKSARCPMSEVEEHIIPQLHHGPI